MSDHQELKEQARAKTRSLLAYSQSFRNMDREEQMALYKDLVDAHYSDLAQEQGLATEMATAGDLIDENRHFNKRIGGVNDDIGDVAGKFIKKVDFPGFVRDLVVGVFNANIDANERQMRAFQNLLKEATKSLSAFVNETDDTEALVRLVQGSDQFRLGLPRRTARQPRQKAGGAPIQPTNSEAPPTPVLLDKNGKEVNMNSPDIKAKILDTKLAMAKEKRTLLRETLLMGVSRLVVEKGTIKAEVNFQISASESRINDDNANVSKNKQLSIGGVDFFGIRVPPIYAEQTNQISVASSNTETSTDVSANMSGYVEIQFKTDYFKLDNFREMFDLGQGQLPPGQNQAPRGAAPSPQGQAPAAAPLPAAPPAPTEFPQV